MFTLHNLVEEKPTVKGMIKQYLIIVIVAFIMAFNISNIARVGGILPGGVAGISMLVQKIARVFFNIAIPYSAIYVPLNIIPIYIGYKYVGKRFTTNSLIMILLMSVMVDIIPNFHVMEDILLCSIFGGLLNGAAIGICLLINTTSGGTDIISIYISKKYKKDAWNYIFAVNVVVLFIAGLLFGIEESLYSIILQFVSTMVIQMIYKRYQKNTLFIITEKVDAVYEVIRDLTNHDGTLFKGVGMYQGKTRNMIYSVVSSEEIGQVVEHIKKVDEHAFINIMKSQQIQGNFYQRNNY